MDTCISSTALYEKNMAVLKRCRPALAQALEQHNDAFELKIDRIQEGECGVLLKDSAGHWELFHPKELYSKEIIAQQMKECVDVIKERDAGFVFYGLDAGLRMCALTELLEAKYTIFVVERYPEIFKTLMTYVDLTKIIQSKNVFFYLGEDSAAQLIAFVRDNLNMRLPLSGAYFCRAQDNDYYTAAASEINRAMAVLSAEAGEKEKIARNYYRGLSRDKIISFFGPERRALNILGELSTETHVMQYVMRDCMQAFGSLGHDTLILEAGCEKSVTNAYFFAKVKDFLPHLWFKINHTSRDAVYIDELVYVSWIHDPFSSVFNPAVKVEYKIGRYEQLMVLTKFFMREMEKVGIPVSRMHYFYFAGNPSLYYPRELTDEETEKYKCDISFVGNFPDLLSSYHFVPAKTVDSIIQQMSTEDRYYWDDFKEIVHAHLQDKEVMPRIEYSLMSYVFSGIGNAALRIPYLASIADSDLHLYGKGWEASPLFKSHARGAIFDKDEVCKIYNASRINLNLSHSTNNHPRIFDVVASGGFLLTRMTAEDEGEGGIGDYFEIGKEIEVFRTQREMHDKISYYLAHEDERKAIAERGRQRLLREHTWPHRMSRLLDIVYQGLQEAD